MERQHANICSVQVFKKWFAIFFLFFLGEKFEDDWIPIWNQSRFNVQTIYCACINCRIPLQNYDDMHVEVRQRSALNKKFHRKFSSQYLIDIFLKISHLPLHRGQTLLLLFNFVKTDEPRALLKTVLSIEGRQRTLLEILSTKLFPPIHIIPIQDIWDNARKFSWPRTKLVPLPLQPCRPWVQRVCVCVCVSRRAWSRIHRGIFESVYRKLSSGGGGAIVLADEIAAISCVQTPRRSYYQSPISN